MTSDGLRPVDEHLAEVLSRVAPLAPLELGLADAHGSYLAEDVTTSIPLPPFDNSSMDGYAVRLEDVRDASPGQPVALPVVADIA
ncbi:MAG TPA: molybdopterin molybdenumtransferase MoeA, partial [Mycobacteriales bacterium]|nr:molybdopterin molybdenumtransferase MoeA [Mycobacteriales bacterium]